MIYTLLRLGFDGVYMIGKVSYDGIYYMVYGSQKSPIELVNNDLYILKNRLDNESMELREIKAILKQIAEKNNISTVPVIDEDDDTEYIV